MIGTDFATPVQTAYEDRTGLRYELDGDTYSYIPASVFFVDGIRYDPAFRGRWSRPMIEIFGDGDGSCSYAAMTFSDPPTEADLNQWIYSGDEDDL